MDATYVVLNGESKGPFTQAQVRDMLARGEVTPETLGWYEGLANWLPLSQILGASASAPAPMASLAPATTAGSTETGFSKEELRHICWAQNLLMWAVLANIVGALLIKVLPFVGLVIAVGILAYILYALCQLTYALRFPVWVMLLLCLTMCIPIISLLVLVIVSGRASKVLKAAGVRVGIMGGKIEDIKD